MEEIIPFFTKIYTYTLQSFDQQKIVSYVEDVHSKDSGVVISNMLGWQSQGINPPSEVMQPVVDEITQQVSVVYRELGLSKFPELGSYWLNINNKNCYNISHTHPGSIISACFYVKTPENCGNIVFERADLMEHYLYGNELTNSTYKTYWMKPKSGDVIIFPSWLPHHVEQNTTDDIDDRRISIAFNFK